MQRAKDVCNGQCGTGESCSCPQTVPGVDYDAELFVPNHIRTYSNYYFNALQPDPHLIHIQDIAHALSQTPRYGGHLPKFYSVAQHSLYVAKILPKPLKLVYRQYEKQIKEADIRALKVEWDVLMMGRKNVDPNFTPGGSRTMRTIERQFLDKFRELR